MLDPVIIVENISKRYLVGHQAHQRERHATLRDVIVRESANFARKVMDVARGKPIIQGDDLEEFWALKNVSFNIKQGEVVGFIGRNGAGKSTLLKILSRITEPTEGRVLLRGRVASLLEVGTGFHPELTGRENIFLNGAILGMSRAEIKRKFDEIVFFADVEKFLDTPVKRYSSGMYVRLAFGVAAHLEPEILIVDEVLSVGDAEFQKKCLGKMSEIVRGGRTVIFVSHNMSAVRQLCSKVFLLRAGINDYEGSPEDAIQRYFSDAGGRRGAWCRAESGRSLKSRAIIEQITLEDRDGLRGDRFSANGSISVHLKISCAERLPSAQVSVRVTNSQGVPIFTTSNCDKFESLTVMQPGKHSFQFKIPEAFLSAGRYYTNVSICTPGVEVIDVVSDEIVFDIASDINHATRFNENRLGVVTPLLEWEHVFVPSPA